ncbi:MAG: transposase, partial [Rhodobacteraceae bacterium]|nr:transposase [Paracoccaceae bacterium]
MGPSRGGLSTKIHVVTKAGGLPLAIHLTPGLTADIAAARDALSLVEARPREVLADKGYDADDLR